MRKKTPNVIVVVIDALRARNLGSMGFGNDASPELDALARSGVLFERAFSTWNTTDPSLTCILTGKYPRSHGITDHGDRADEAVRARFAQGGTKLAAEVLKEAGYETAAVDWMGRWFKRGFDQYGFRPEGSLGQKWAHRVRLPGLYLRYALDHLPILQCYRPVRRPGLKDLAEGMKGVLSTFAFTYRLAEVQDAGSVTRLALDFLARPREKPFFLFLHYWDTHTPYHCPRGFLPENTRRADREAYLVGRYAGAVKYVDFQLGRLFAQLKEIGQWENTLLVVTSDHGDSLTEHGIYFDHHGLYDESTHVAMILHYPARWTAGRRIGSFVQHIDLLPTICEVAGVPTPAGVDGVSLMPLIEGKVPHLRDAVFSEESYVQRKAALRTSRYKYIRALDGKGWCRYCEKVHVGVEELYDLQEDPAETRDLAQAQPALAAQMRLRLDAMIAELDRQRESHGTVRPAEVAFGETAAPVLATGEDELIKERLKKLGYL